MSKLLELHARPRSDAILTLEKLLADARAGRLHGIAFVAMYCRREYIVDVVGETRRCPTFTRGMLHVLDDQLARIIRHPE